MGARESAKMLSADSTKLHNRVRQWRLHITKTSERGYRLNTRHRSDCARERCVRRIEKHDERFSWFRNATRCDSA